VIKLAECTQWCLKNYPNPATTCLLPALSAKGPCYVCGPFKTSPTQQLCKGACTDTASDKKNCGQCNNAVGQSVLLDYGLSLIYKTSVHITSDMSVFAMLCSHRYLWMHRREFHTVLLWPWHGINLQGMPFEWEPDWYMLLMAFSYVELVAWLMRVKAHYFLELFYTQIMIASCFSMGYVPSCVINHRW
jgi:hypothetical protein